MATSNQDDTQVTSAWRKTDTGLALDVTIPGNCTATIRLPKLGQGAVVVCEGDTTLWKDGAVSSLTEGISGAAEAEDNVTFEVGAGSFSFSLTGNEGRSVPIYS